VTPTPTPVAFLTFTPSSATIHATYDSDNGAKAKTKKVTLKNKKKTAGGASINIASATVGKPFLFNASTTCNGFSILPGKSCKVTVTFTPPPLERIPTL
jgi:hypothetical protein